MIETQVEAADNSKLIAEARELIAHCRTYNFGMWSADKLTHEVAGKLADALEAARAAHQSSEDGKYILRLIETIKQTGGSVEVAGVKIIPCDEFGRTAAAAPVVDGEKLAEVLHTARFSRAAIPTPDWRTLPESGKEMYFIQAQAIADYLNGSDLDK